MDDDENPLGQVVCIENVVDCLTAGGRSLRFVLAQIDHVIVIGRWRQRAGRRNVIEIVYVVFVAGLIIVFLINDGRVGQVEGRTSLIDYNNSIGSVIGWSFFVVVIVVASTSTAEVPPATTAAVVVVVAT